MLEVLHIKSLALIDDMTLEFSDGMNVLTGETGAGKSFILKALGFVTGDKLTAEIVRPGAEKAQVEALFIQPDNELVLKRELASSNGRSRFYINNSLNSQEALRELGPSLISHASQHAQQRLLLPAYQARLLEQGLSEELLNKRDKLLARLKELDNAIQELAAKQAGLAEKRELLEMQKAEIDKVSPQPGEEEKLEENRSALRARKNASQNYHKAMAILHGEEAPGLMDLLIEFERLLGQMAKTDESLSKDIENIEALRQQLSETANSLRRPPSPVSKMNMDEIEERLFAFSQLKRKLKRTMPQILELKEEIKENLSFLDVCNLDLSRLRKEEEKAASELKDLLKEIKPLRRAAAQKFASALEEQLKDLGFSEHVKVVPDFHAWEIWPGIEDERGRICWAPNPGQPPQALDKIASGGELSRFLLALSILNPENENLTFIFDEVDAGVGGLTLNKMGDKLENLAKKHQIILITHWPQLAVRAKKHFQISKTVKNGNTYTQCLPLNNEERAKELARMAGGGKEGDALAAELIQANR